MSCGHVTACGCPCGGASVAAPAVPTAGPTPFTFAPAEPFPAVVPASPSEPGPPALQLPVPVDGGPKPPYVFADDPGLSPPLPVLLPPPSTPAPVHPVPVAARREARPVQTVAPRAIGGGVVAFADDLVMVADVGSPTTIVTEPYPLGGSDRVSVVANALYLFGGSTSRTLLYKCQTSLDGIHWVDQGPTDQLTSTIVMPVQSDAVYGTSIRFVYEFTVTGGSGTGAICFKLLAQLAKS